MPGAGSSSSDPRLRLWLERGESGYWLRDASTGEAVRWTDPRLRVVKLAGSSYRGDELQDDGFAPGNRLALARPPAVHRPSFERQLVDQTSFRTASATRAADGTYASSIVQYGYGTS